MDQMLLGKLKDERYCLFFYVIMVIQLFFLVLGAIGLVFCCFKLKKISMHLLLNNLAVFIFAILSYLQTRIFYSMCHIH